MNVLFDEKGEIDLQRAVLLGLGAILVTITMFALWNLFFGSRPLTAVEKKEGTFKCEKCGHEFVINHAVWARQAKEYREKNGKAPPAYRAHCPECGAEWGGQLMRQCPHCKQYIVPQKPKSGVGQYTCPRCGKGLNMGTSRRSAVPKTPGPPGP